MPDSVLVPSAFRFRQRALPSAARRQAGCLHRCGTAGGQRQASQGPESFLGLMLAGSLIWNSVLILAGYFLGENWALVEEYAGAFQVLVTGAVAGLVVLFVVGKLRKRRAGVRA